MAPLLSTIKVTFVGHGTITYSSPALLETIMSNYNIHVLFQRTPLPHVTPLDAKSFDPDMAKQFHMISSLNRAGRSYLASDGHNKHMGLNVLGSVSDNMDCLYYHLRENPVLCEREGAVDLKQPH